MSGTPSADSTSVDLGSIQVNAPQHTFVDPHPTRSLDVGFVDAGQIVGWDPGSGSVKPGDAIHPRLVWRAFGRSGAAYTVFIHLLNSTGKIVGQRDEAPNHNARPTTTWVAGEYIEDPHDVDVPLAAPPGTYQIEVGLYDPTSGQRVRLTTSADSAIIGSVEILPR